MQTDKRPSPSAAQVIQIHLWSWTRANRQAFTVGLLPHCGTS